MVDPTHPAPPQTDLGPPAGWLHTVLLERFNQKRSVRLNVPSVNDVNADLSHALNAA